MKKLCLLVVICGVSIVALGQTKSSSGAPSVRDAVLDWAFAKDTSTFERHFPNSLRAAMKATESEVHDKLLEEFKQLLLLDRGFKMEKHAGNAPFITAEDPYGDKFAATLLDEDVHGAKATFEVIIRRWQDGKESLEWGWPRVVIVHARLEEGTWRLVRADLPSMKGDGDTYDLEDPDLIYGLIHGFAAANERAALRAVQAIVRAERQYALRFRDVGFTCTLGDLGSASSPIAVDLHHANLLEARLAGGSSRGYTIYLNGCGDSPSPTFMVIAYPDSPGNSGKNALCADEQGTVYYADNGDGATCAADRLALGK